VIRKPSKTRTRLASARGIRRRLFVDALKHSSRQTGTIFLMACKKSLSPFVPAINKPIAVEEGQTMHGEDASAIMTDHARERARARGIPLRIVRAIFANADRSPFVGEGRRSLMVSRRKLDRLSESISAGDRERMDGVVLVVDSVSQVIVTVLHADGRKGRRYRRQWDGGIYRPRRRRLHWHPRQGSPRLIADAGTIWGVV
jgi:hypothetical protein